MKKTIQVEHGYRLHSHSECPKCKEPLEWKTPLYKNQDIAICDDCGKELRHYWNKSECWHCDICQKDYCIDCAKNHLGYGCDFEVITKYEDTNFEIWACKECIESPKFKRFTELLTEYYSIQDKLCSIVKDIRVVIHQERQKYDQEDFE